MIRPQQTYLKKAINLNQPRMFFIREQLLYIVPSDTVSVDDFEYLKTQLKALASKEVKLNLSNEEHKRLFNEYPHSIFQPICTSGTYELKFNPLKRVRTSYMLHPDNGALDAKEIEAKLSELIKYSSQGLIEVLQLKNPFHLSEDLNVRVDIRPSDEMTMQITEFEDRHRILDNNGDIIHCHINLGIPDAVFNDVYYNSTFAYLSLSINAQPWICKLIYWTDIWKTPDLQKENIFYLPTNTLSYSDMKEVEEAFGSYKNHDNSSYFRAKFTS